VLIFTRSGSTPLLKKNAATAARRRAISEPRDVVDAALSMTTVCAGCCFKYPATAARSRSAPLLSSIPSTKMSSETVSTTPACERSPVTTARTGKAPESARTVSWARWPCAEQPAISMAAIKMKRAVRGRGQPVP